MTSAWVTVKMYTVAGARLAQSVEHGTLNPRVVGSSPTLGEVFFILPSFTLPALFMYCVVKVVSNWKLTGKADLFRVVRCFSIFFSFLSGNWHICT